jgi:hypothetical protein
MLRHAGRFSIVIIGFRDWLAFIQTGETYQLKKYYNSLILSLAESFHPLSTPISILPQPHPQPQSLPVPYLINPAGMHRNKTNINYNANIY